VVYYSSYALTPIIPFDAAAPCEEALLAAVAVELESPEYVYLLRVVTAPEQFAFPKAKIPVDEFPVALWYIDGAVADVPDETTQPE
jgi:hypothetical protein